MNQLQLAGATALLTLSIGVPQPVQANTCGDLRPVESSSASDHATKNKNIDAIDALISSVKTHSLRSGSGVRYVCRGVGDRQRVETTEFKLIDLNLVEALNGSLTLTGWEDSKRKVKSAEISIAPTDAWQLTGTNAMESLILARRGNFTTNLLTPNARQEIQDQGVVGTTASRDRIAVPVNSHDLNAFPQNRGSHYIEIATELSSKSRTLQLTQTIYIGGEKAEWVVWKIN